MELADVLADGLDDRLDDDGLEPITIAGCCDLFAFSDLISSSFALVACTNCCT